MNKVCKAIKKIIQYSLTELMKKAKELNPSLNKLKLIVTIE